jgi:hypothetical protein
MNELQTIREALEYCRDELKAHVAGPALEALARIVVREASFATAEDRAKEVAETIDNSMLRLDKQISTVYGPVTPPRVQLDKAIPLISFAMSQYAYRYSEDIRKDRDYWQKTAMAFHDAVHQHIKNNTPIKSECQGCEGQGLDCAESCLRPKNSNACPNCGASPLRLEARSRDGSNSASVDCIAVCQSCKRPMPEDWSQQ